MLSFRSCVIFFQRVVYPTLIFTLNIIILLNFIYLFYQPNFCYLSRIFFTEEIKIIQILIINFILYVRNFILTLCLSSQVAMYFCRFSPSKLSFWTVHVCIWSRKGDHRGFKWTGKDVMVITIYLNLVEP